MGEWKEACFAAGCFWCITPVFMELEGVKKVVCGYSGGQEADPVYALVKAQKTHHRECVRITYDPELTDFPSLMECFLEHVDPFDAGGQFIDRGNSYTLAFYWNEESERDTALEMIRQLEKKSGRKTFIAVEPAGVFYPAEEEHQDYYLRHPAEFEEELRASGRKKG